MWEVPAGRDVADEQGMSPAACTAAWRKVATRLSRVSQVQQPSLDFLEAVGATGEFQGTT